ILTFDVDNSLLPPGIQNNMTVPFKVHHLNLLLMRLIKDKINKRASYQTYRQSWIKPILNPRIPLLADESATDSILRQSEVFTVLSPYLKQCEAILLDAGNCAAAAAHYLNIPSGVKTLIALGMGGMGYAIAAAIGAKMVSSCPKSVTVVIAGDGAFMITGLEIHTAIAHELPILYLLFNNHSHGMCVTRQSIFFGGRKIASTYPHFCIKQIVSGLQESEKNLVACATNINEFSNLLQKYFENQKAGTGIIEIALENEEIPPFIPLNPDFQELSCWP
ncbi:MAG: hypothetical protein HQK54_13550, partial [Oligoflexales bacterium]|nr:hypothetical protein [Oligoflexales bacterium]